MDNNSLWVPSASVLMIDDTEINFSMMWLQIKDTGIRMETAGSGDKGLALTKTTPYDIIFLDHVMPEKDGIQTLKELRAQTDGCNAHTPVICLTGNITEGAREEYLTDGFDDYLTKPVDSARLLEVLRKFLPKEKIEGEDTSTGASGVSNTQGTGGDNDSLAFLRGQDVINVDEGIRNSGSVEAYLSLVNVFKKAIDEKADQIQSFYDEHDIQNYTVKVHAAKSSARIIGASAFGEFAQKLEDAGKKEDMEYINAHHDEFIRTYRGFSAILGGGEEKASDGAGKPEADAGRMKAFYGELKEAAEDMDCDRLLEAIDGMKKFRIPQADQELFEKLSEAAENYDYMTVEELLG